tara:strand:+ start:9605 stop:10351 length:747 start_codon:yes stop_codon:yes gene_type:complete
MTQAFCKVSIAPVRAEGRDQAELVTQLLFGELAIINEVNLPWARITTVSDNYSGFIDYKHIEEINSEDSKKHLENSSHLMNRETEISTLNGKQRICRGSLFPVNEVEFQIGTLNFNRNTSLQIVEHSIISLAHDYLNTPYLWGGKSPFGIDCSGITQVIYSLKGIQLPRDASQQAHLGTAIAYNETKSGDLAFFENKKGTITHVGILDGEGNIIHAAGHVRKDLFSNKGILHSETKELTHSLSCIKRP